MRNSLLLIIPLLMGCLLQSLNSCNISMIVLTDQELTTALTCAENGETNIISVGANIQSFTSFTIQNTNQLLITKLSSILDDIQILVRTQRVFRILSSTIRFSFLSFIGSSLSGGITISSSNVTISNCIIKAENNIPTASSVLGGGFQVSNHSSLTLFNSTVSSWKVAYGGAAYLSSSNLFVFHSMLSNNQALESGGAISLISNCTLEIGQSSNLLNNIAADFGGAIYSEGMNTISLDYTNLKNNSAGEDGGAIYLGNAINDPSNQLSLRGVHLERNHADNYAGAIYLSGTFAQIDDVICSDNYASIAGGCLALFWNVDLNASKLTANYNILGNGIPTSIGGAVFLSTGAEIVCSDCLFSNNFAGEGGGIGNLGGDLLMLRSSFLKNTAGSGGVLFSQNIQRFQNQFVDCIFQDNEAENNGGVFYIDRSPLQVNSSLLQRNVLKSSTDNRGGILFSSNSSSIFFQVNITDSFAAVGGAFLCTQESIFYLENSTVTNVHASNNGGVIRTEYNSRLWLTGVNFQDCYTEGNGGIMNVQASAIVTILECNFYNSFSGGLGGIIYVTTNSQISITDSHLVSSSARDSGGCIGANGAIVLLYGGSFSRCSSTSGGAIFLQSSVLRSEDTTFLHNYGDQGGSILADADTDITLNRVQFLNNSATYKGGSILLTGGLMVATHSLFNGSHSQYGGAVHASVGARVVLLSSTVSHNFASYDGGAFLLQSGENSYFNGTTFEHNRANTGAVMYITHSEADFWKCTFIANEAFEAAGGCALFQESSVQILESIFRMNRGYLGGVFSVDFSTLTVDNSIFSDNSADSTVLLILDPGFLLDINTVANGYGAVFYSFLGTVFLTRCNFLGNKGYVGGVGWAQLTMIISENNIYSQNYASTGGVYSVNEHNIFNSSNDQFISNIAEFEGSALHGMNFGTVFFHFSQFHGHNLTIFTASVAVTQGTIIFENCFINATGFLLLSRVNLQILSSQIFQIYTLTGGAVQILSQSVTLIKNSTFQSNFAEITAGAISYRNADSNLIINSTFLNNTAKAGGAIEAVGASLNITNSLFSYNKAKQAGGGIFWSDSIIVLSNNTFIKNIATFGPNYATTPMSLAITNPEDFLVPQSSGFELSSPVNIVAVDSYGQHIYLTEYLDIFPFSSIVVAQTVDAYSSISGITIQTLDIITGYTRFSNLTVTLQPLSNVTLEFSIQGSSRINSAFLMIHFRGCISGEIQTSISETQAICSKCKEGTYSFDPTDTVCTPCPDHADCPGGNIINVHHGYWRQCSTCHEIKQCKTSKACLGGTDTSSQCLDGYEGPLCDVCSNGYFRSGRDFCVSCGAGTSYIEIIFAIFILIIFIFLIFLWKNKDWIQEKFQNFAEKVDEALRKYELKTYLTKMKILIGFLQILVNIPEVLAVVFPRSFSLLLNSLNLINFNFLKIFATQCYYYENFYTNLLLSTLFPPILIIIIDTILRIKYYLALRLNNNQPFYSYKQKNIDRRIIFLIIAFCVFSPVSIIIFQTFVCEKFENNKNYLVADYSVECYTDIHYQYILYSSFMIILYPIGIPFYYIYHLARKKDYINPSTSLVVRKEERHIVSNSVIQEMKIQLRSNYESIHDISFLYDSYLPSCWYFEIIECFRRIALTALPVLFLRSTIIQVVLVLIVSLGFSALYMELRPFVKNSDNAVAIVSQWTLSLTFLGALCLKVDLSEDNINTTLYIGIILSLVNGFTLFLTFYLVIVVNDEDDHQRQLEENTTNPATTATTTSPLGSVTPGTGTGPGPDMKLQDLSYEYDSDDDSERSSNVQGGVNRIQSIELETMNKNKKNQEIRSLKEYQRRASIKQQILEQQQQQQQQLEQETSCNGSNGQSKVQRKGSVRRNSTNATCAPTMNTSSNHRKQPIHETNPHRPSEVEDYDIFRYTHSSMPNSDDTTTNPIIEETDVNPRLSPGEVDTKTKPNFLGYFFPQQSTNSDVKNKPTQQQLDSTPDSDDEV